MVVTLVVVALGIFVAVRWGQNVVREAKEEAREAAKREIASVAPAHVRAYLDEKTPGQVADALAAMTAGGGSSAAEQAEDLGGDAG